MRRSARSDGVAGRACAAAVSPELPSALYWESVGDTWQALGRDRLWRHASDDLHLQLLRGWDVDTQVGVTLKTDLFDEAATGELGGALVAEAGHLIGIDTAMNTVRAAARRLPTASLLVADVRALPIAPGALDLIVSNSTLDHLARQEEIVTAIRGLAAALAPGGHDLLTLDNPQHPLLWLRARASWLQRVGLVPYRTGPTLSQAALVQACQGAGLTVLHTGTLCHCPRVLAVWVGRLLERRSAATQQAYRRAVLAFERLAAWPTHLITGRFVAVLACTAAQAGELTAKGGAPC